MKNFSSVLADDRRDTIHTQTQTPTVQGSVLSARRECETETERVYTQREVYTTRVWRQLLAALARVFTAVLLILLYTRSMRFGI